MTFEEKLKTYAELIVVHGLNVQENHFVNIGTEVCHRDFALLVSEAAYKRGASYVHIDFNDPRFARQRILLSQSHNLSFVPSYISAKSQELVELQAANLRIIGSENPDILSDLSPERVNTVRHHQRLAMKYFYDEGIGKSKVHWTVAAAATPLWGKKVFPALSESEAQERLWEEIFHICRADSPQAIDIWRAHNEHLHRRSERLNRLKLKTLHFTGPGTDLRVGLSEQALFKGGSDIGPRGASFEPNIPTEEVFTTPDWRATTGSVKTTRPFLINGRLIRGLELVFERGEISSFSAQDGEDTFREYINSDEGAKRLGEVALVGIDSPVYQSGLVFQEILFDENAACHIAVGSAYKFCLSGGESMDSSKLEEIGCNESSVHTDMMISSEEVSVCGETYGGEVIQLINQGAWVI